MHPGQRLRPGARVVFERGGRRLCGEVLARRFHGRRTVRLWTEDGSDVDEAVDRVGHVPLPPYIRRGDTPLDAERYQTVYATERGVGGGADGRPASHRRPAGAASATRGRGRPGDPARRATGRSPPYGWTRSRPTGVAPEPYPRAPGDRGGGPPRPARRGGGWSRWGRPRPAPWRPRSAPGAGSCARGGGVSDLYLYPGAAFHVVGGLLTNFHLPRSSLLMLVSAFAGWERIRGAYAEALRAGYRFYSFGDAMLIL